ncbi:MAG: hypothetical protein NVS9B6_16150 [Candidatus Limnocylindrales bacterium]
MGVHRPIDRARTRANAQRRDDELDEPVRGAEDEQARRRKRGAAGNKAHGPESFVECAGERCRGEIARGQRGEKEAEISERKTEGLAD